MSIYGMQLPKQMALQRQTGPVQQNKGHANIYQTPDKNFTSSFQWTSYQKPKGDLYNQISKGAGTVLQNNQPAASQNFDMTLRNTHNPFHSSGVRQLSFNDQKYDRLAQQSRYRADEAGSASPDKKPSYYDIKGNTFKSTLIPSETAKVAFKNNRKSMCEAQAFKDFANTHTEGFLAGSQATMSKVKPQHTIGYKRSGMILFNNINQVNTIDQRTPRAIKSRVEEHKTPMAAVRNDRNNSMIDAAGTSENYKQWAANTQPVKNKRYTQRPASLNTSKTKFEIEKNIEQSQNYSPEFRLKKNNNYDNIVANASRKVLEESQLQRYFDRKPAFTSSRNASQPDSFINLGHSVGPGGRAVLYASVKKNVYARAVPTKTERAPVGDASEIHTRNQKAASLKSWNHYDSNIKNLIGIQTKIIDSKNYELDSRANSINDYGYQPLLNSAIDNKRKIDGIMLDQTKGRNPEERLPLYKRKFTPITSYVKQLHDTRISALYDNKLNVFRPNINQ